MMIEMEVRELQRSQEMPQQIVILAEKDGGRRFPIFIGGYEAEALDMALHGQKAARPLTHDLVLNAIESMGGDLDSIYVDELRDGTFYGKLIVRMAGSERVQIDTRPSDALVLATKLRAPIFVSSEILDTIEADEATESDSEGDDELEADDPDDRE